MAFRVDGVKVVFFIVYSLGVLKPALLEFLPDRELELVPCFNSIKFDCEEDVRLKRVRTSCLDFGVAETLSLGRADFTFFELCDDIISSSS